MSHIKLILPFLLLAFVLNGCNAADTDADCGEGTARQVDGQTYCLYQSNLIIEGFECPNQMTPHEVPNGMVCSPNSDLPDDLIDPFDPMNPWCIANCDVITDPDPLPNTQPKPLNASDFQRIYRYRDYACVVDSSSKATCWGPAFDGRLKMINKTYTNVNQMGLGEHFICVLKADQTIDCQGGNFQSQFDGNKRYTSISAGLGSVCALGGLMPPYNTLDCIADNNIAVTFANLAQQSQWLGEPFNQFTVKRGENGGRIASGCGITNNADIRCLTTSGSTEIAGNYKALQHDTTEVICGINADNKMACWNYKTSAAIASPDGEFVEMYDPYCGLLETNKVVCWLDLTANTQKDQPLTLTTLFNKHPRAFDVHQNPRDQQPHWCAIKLNGDLECSDF